MNAACTRSGFSGVPKPSMVVTRRPATLLVGTTHDRTAWSSRSTVHVPHCPMTQPALVPVSPREPRSAYSRGWFGSQLFNVTARPLTWQEYVAMASRILREADRRHLLHDPITTMSTLPRGHIDSL